MKRFFLCLVVACTTFNTVFSARTNSSHAEALVANDSIKTFHLNDVLVIGNRAGSQTPVAQTNLEAKAIKELTVANNLPYVLWMTPSLVTTSENGTGAGNSSFRIRGTDATRINVTLNGVPLNNPEEQEVYYVDIPDMTSALQSIQVQRGVGTSTNGTGAFGASVNMTTKAPGIKPYVESATTAGSYGTFQQNIAFGTGLFGNGYSLDMRYSNLTTDGYIRNGWCKHQSLFATLDKRFEHAELRFNYIYGSEHTGITWEGISEDQMKNDPTYNPAGEITNGIYYDNESDNYRQHYIQAFYTQELGKNLLLNAGLNYTNGFGYYEEYKQDESFSSMGIKDQTIEDSTYVGTALVRRKNMSNGFYTANLNLQYRKNGLNVQAGSMYTYYDGQHYATLLWAANNQDIPANYEWVRNSAKKTDANTFVKAEFSPVKGLNGYIDLQYRYVDYQLNGIDDDDMLDMTQHRTWNFFNPKAGLFYQINSDQHAFASVAIAHREPTRSDIKDAVKKSESSSDIKAEKLTDYELGYTFDNKKIMASVNVYYMDYKDQLVPTGKLNDVGYKLMSNVDKSYRLGVELSAGYKPNTWMQLDVTSTLSRNRVVDYTVWYDTYNSSDDNTGWVEVVDPKDQITKKFKEAALPFSPELTGAAGITLTPVKDFKFNLTEKYVSEQYITNTQNDDLKLPAYNSANVSLTHYFKIKGFADAEFGIYVNNLFSNRYSCNAWGYESHFLNGDTTQTGKGLYPVAPRNYLAKLTLRF
ncbi:MAG: TonB-dependent receptor [Bacteroidales bacterium]|nr:TonB-dependent receptor [Bacteroidales bacterium]